MARYTAYDIVKAIGKLPRDRNYYYVSETNKGVIRIEPQCGAVNCLNSGMGLLRLKPGQKETFRLWFHTI